MYLDALDPVRTSESQLDTDTCMNFNVQGESMILKTLLEGERPALTQTQVMDSKVIHNILWEQENRDHFLALISSGHINIAMYENLRAQGIYGLQSYFLKTLENGLIDGESFHNYSMLPFLQDLDDDVRRNFHRKIIDAVTNHYYDFKTDGVSHEYVEFVENYVNNLHSIDWALRGRFKKMGPFTKGFDDLFLQGYYILKENLQEDDEILILCQEMITRYKFYNTRSRYYHYLDLLSKDFSLRAKRIVKSLVDMCYNESIASTMPRSQYNFSIEKGSEDLIKCLEQKEKPLSKEEVLIVPKKDTKYFTWESLAYLFKEVDQIQREHNLSRLEALEDYKARNSLQKPALKIAKYVTLGLAPSLIPYGDGIMQIITFGANLVVGDLINETFKRPSTKEVISEIQDYKEKRKVLEKAIKFTSVTK